MPTRPSPRHLRVFLSSPGDVTEERAIARHLIKNDLPANPFLKGRVWLQVIAWDDPAVPGRLRPLILAAVAYFILPADIIPEDLHGPYGYVDDIFLCALVADQIRRELRSEDSLLSNWDGEAPLVPLIDDVLAREKELIGDRRARILGYIGYEHLIG